MTRLYALAITFALAGCATSGGGLMSEILSSWSGAATEEVFAQWGYPHEQREIAGRQLLVWRREVGFAMPGTANTTAYRVGNQVFAQTSVMPGVAGIASCTRILEIKDNRVVGGQAEGGNCPFMEIGPYADWRRKAR